MNDAAEKPNTIGIIAKKLGITSRSIRYYEEIGLMGTFERSEGNYRIYGENEIIRLKFIFKLKDLGISLNEMKELSIYYDLNNKDVDKILPRLLDLVDANIGKIDRKISNLISLRKDISDYKLRIMDCLKDKQQWCEYKK